MAAVSIGSWFFPALGQRSTSCGPLLPHHPFLPTHPRQCRCGRTTMARAWPHLALIKPRQSSFISPAHLAGLCRASSLRGDVWHILHSPELPFTGWFIRQWTLQICVIYCRRIIDYFYIKPRKLIYLHKAIDLVVVIRFFPILTGILKSLPPYFLDFPLKQKW